MSDLVHIDPRPFIDYDRKSGSATIPTTGVYTLVLSFRAFMGKDPYITNFGQAWDASMTDLAFELRVNGNPLPKFQGQTVQLTPPESRLELDVYEHIAQGDLVEVYMKNTIAAATGVSSITIRYKDLH